MLTLFTVPKPFRGHIGLIQRNAIRSWTHLEPRCDILLFGDDDGTAAVAREFGVRHLPKVARNEYGTPLLSDVFVTAERSAQHRLMCYVNADIILMNDFLEAVSRIRKDPFLMIGRRWDLDVTEEVDFDNPHWAYHLRSAIRGNGVLHSYMGVDYYAFPRGMWGEIPPFAIGRTVYDNWLIWRARVLSVPVIDATSVVECVHQNHERTYTSLGMIAPDDTDDLTKGIEARRNRQLAGGRRHVFTLRNANWLLTRRWLLPALKPVNLVERLKTSIRSLILYVLKPVEP